MVSCRNRCGSYTDPSHVIVEPTRIPHGSDSSISDPPRIPRIHSSIIILNKRESRIPCGRSPRILTHGRRSAGLLFGIIRGGRWPGLGELVGRRSSFLWTRRYLYYAPHCTVGSVIKYPWNDSFHRDHYGPTPKFASGDKLTTNSFRHPLALELHHPLASRPQLLGQAQEACAGRRRKGRRVQVVLHPRLHVGTDEAPLRDRRGTEWSHVGT